MNPIGSSFFAPQDTTLSPYQSLIKRLSVATKELHTLAAKQPFVQSLLQRTVSQEQYTHYIADLHGIYSALEKGLEKNHLLPYITQLHLPNLYRTEKLAADLKAFSAENIQPSFVAKEYVQHIETIAQNAPHKLIAHAYTRYLGEFFGGQSIGRSVTITWGKEKANAYEYIELLKEFSLDLLGQFIPLYCEILNGLPLKEQELKEVVEESIIAFEFANNMLANLH